MLWFVGFSVNFQASNGFAANLILGFAFSVETCKFGLVGLRF